MEEFKQKTDFSAGAATLRFLLYNMRINKCVVDIPSEDELIHVLGINNENVADPFKIISYGLNNGFKVFFSEDTTFDKLRELKSNGWYCLLPIMVDIPHYVYYENSNETHISFWDSFTGEFQNEMIRKFINEKRTKPLFRWRVNQTEIDVNKSLFTGRDSNRMVIAFKK